jgi:hypothetical protein
LNPSPRADGGPPGPTKSELRTDAACGHVALRAADTDILIMEFAMNVDTDTDERGLVLLCYVVDDLFRAGVEFRHELELSTLAAEGDGIASVH